MQCQYFDCTNVGVHSCSNCGKLVCGKHAHVFSGYTVSIQCETCYQAERQAEHQAAAARVAEKDKEENQGCIVGGIGLGILVLGVLLLVVGNGTFLALFGLILGGVGFITCCVGFAHFWPRNL